MSSGASLDQSRNWTKVAIGDVVELKQGMCFNKKTNHLVTDQGLPILRIKDLINNTESQFAVADGVPQRYIATPKDIIFTRTGQVGLVFKGRVGVVHNNCFRVIPVGDIFHDYVYWYLRQHEVIEYAKSLASGAAQPDLTHTAFKSIPFRYPNLDIQRRITRILSAYDDLIENNRSRIQLLEQSARLLYKEWFVHVRFPGHEHVKIVDGVPEGWEKKTVPEVIEINPKVAVPEGISIRHVPMADISTSGMTVDLRGSEMRTKSTSVRFTNGDTLFARITPCLENGKTGFVNFLNEEEVACGSTEFIVMRGISVSPYFTYCIARTNELRKIAIKSMIGSSGRQRVQVSCFNDILVAKPPRAIQSLFDSACESAFKQVAQLVSQIRLLGAARDLLLPRLMNGEISV